MYKFTVSASRNPIWHSCLTPIIVDSDVGHIQATGLGLAIVHQATALLDGSIKIESNVGLGTAVIVTLPIVKVFEN